MTITTCFIRWSILYLPILTALCHHNTATTRKAKGIATAAKIVLTLVVLMISQADKYRQLQSILSG